MKKRIFNKKGDVLGMPVATLIEVFFFVLISIIAWKLISLGIDAYKGETLDHSTITSLDRIKLEIDTMSREKGLVPVSIDSNHKIVSYSSPPESVYTKTECDKDNPCICIISNNEKVKECRKLEQKVVPFVVVSKSAPYNIILAKTSDVISCTDCAKKT